VVNQSTGANRAAQHHVWPLQLHHHVEEIPTGEEVLVGMFFLNEWPIIILFYSRASHDFMRSTCAEKAKLKLVALRAPYVISRPRGQVHADRIALKFPLELSGGYLAPTSLF
jgi:hypothetical protein